MIDFIRGPKRINYKVLLPSACESPEKFLNYLHSYAGVLLVVILEAELLLILNVISIVQILHSILTHPHPPRLQTGQTCHPLDPLAFIILSAQLWLWGIFQFNALVRRESLSFVL